MIEQFLGFICDLPIGTPINKPSGGTSQNLGWSKDGQSLCYSIGHNISKGCVNNEDLRLAVAQLEKTGKFTRPWWKSCKKMQSHKPCNFTTIGGLLEMSRLAKYSNPGEYTATKYSRSLLGVVG